MKPRRSLARKRINASTKRRNILSRVRKGRRAPHKITPNSKRQRKFRNIHEEDSTSSVTSTDSQRSIILSVCTNSLLAPRNMEDVWLAACKNIQIPETVAKIWLVQIKARMSQDSGRFFHNWSELVEPKARYLQDASELLVFAVCFQYYEYDVKKSCVAENCKAFRNFCSEGGYHDEASVKKVERLLGNEHVESYEGFESDVQTLQDLDLIVLGLPEDQYKKYTQLLRKEYSHLNDACYKSMRSKILQTFLTIPTIYTTESFRDNLEERARFNIKSEIDDLKK